MSKNFPQYQDWAAATLVKIKPSVYTWQGMSLAEASARVLALCKHTEKNNLPWVFAYDHLKTFADYINEKYPPR